MHYDLCEVYGRSEMGNFIVRGEDAEGAGYGIQDTMQSKKG